MSPTKSTSRLRNVLSNLRAAHQRSSDEWIRRMEAPAQPSPPQRRH